MRVDWSDRDTRAVSRRESAARRQNGARDNDQLLATFPNHSARYFLFVHLIFHRHFLFSFISIYLTNGNRYTLTGSWHGAHARQK